MQNNGTPEPGWNNTTLACSTHSTDLHYVCHCSILAEQSTWGIGGNEQRTLLQPLYVLIDPLSCPAVLGPSQGQV